jgi:glycosyltransferase involved in cell wall biosynthesis
VQKPVASFEPATVAAAPRRPTMTVMVITYNHAKYIGRCLDSILAQKVDFPLAIHVADDCSTDGAQDIIRDYAARYPGVVKPFINKKNIGRKVTQKNFYRGFSTLDGDYCAVIEGDDFMASRHRLRTHVEFLEANPDYVGCANHTLKVYEDGSKDPHLFLPSPEKPDHWLQEFILLESFFHASSLTFRNVFRGRVPRYLRSPLSCDIFMTIAHAEHGKIRFFPEPWSIYRAHIGGLFSSMSALKGWMWNIDGLRACNRWLGFRHFPVFAEAIRRYCEYVVKHATAEQGATPELIRKYQRLGRRYAWLSRQYLRGQALLAVARGRLSPPRVHVGEPQSLNLGSGSGRRPDFINVDIRPDVAPDVLWDLNRTPWPWPTDFAERVRLLKTLEYLGPTPERLQAILRELYRVCRDGATVAIKSTHPRTRQFLDDPKIVRTITPELFQPFDATLPHGAGEAPLAEANGVDFEVVQAQVILAEPYLSQLRRGELSSEGVQELLQTRLDVALEHRIELRVHKPPRPLRTTPPEKPAGRDGEDEIPAAPRDSGHLER